MTEKYTHQAVLLQEAIDALAIHPAGVYLDGTLGRGGHSRLILEHLGQDGRLIAFDQDPVLADADQRPAELAEMFADPRFEFVSANFVSLQAELEKRDLLGRINGILLDIGVSSPQIDDPARGFSSDHDGPLDMRMDTRQGSPASEWLASVDESTLARVIKRYGEHPRARTIAQAILREQSFEPITTTRELRDVILKSVGPSPSGKSPVGQVFQAIRIEINRELQVLEETLPQCAAALTAGGRLAVISFHSLEDRVVKTFIQRESAGNDWVPGMPVPEYNQPARFRQITRLLRPSAEAIEANPRARSARLRVAERLSL